MESEEKKKAYNEYVERITPNNSLTKDMWNAFWIGGLICVMGQIWLELFMYFGMDKEDSASYTTLILILESREKTAACNRQRNLIKTLRYLSVRKANSREWATPTSSNRCGTSATSPFHRTGTERKSS